MVKYGYYMLLIHPFFLINYRVITSPLNSSYTTRRIYESSFSAAKHILKTEGWKGFYHGFGVGVALYSTILFPELYCCIRESVNDILNTYIYQKKPSTFMGNYIKHFHL